MALLMFSPFCRWCCALSSLSVVGVSEMLWWRADFLAILLLVMSMGNDEFGLQAFPWLLPSCYRLVPCSALRLGSARDVTVFAVAMDLLAVLMVLGGGLMQAGHYMLLGTRVRCVYITV